MGKKTRKRKKGKNGKKSRVKSGSQSNMCETKHFKLNIRFMHVDRRGRRRQTMIIIISSSLDSFYVLNCHSLPLALSLLVFMVIHLLFSAFRYLVIVPSFLVFFIAATLWTRVSHLIGMLGRGSKKLFNVCRVSLSFVHWCLFLSQDFESNFFSSFHMRRKQKSVEFIWYFAGTTKRATLTRRDM